MKTNPSPEAPAAAGPTGGRSPWAWIPTLYFGQGIPYVVVMTLSVVMYKNLKLSNTEIALYTSWLYLPWVIKPLWAPLVDLLGTKRGWIVAMRSGRPWARWRRNALASAHRARWPCWLVA